MLHVATRQTAWVLRLFLHDPNAELYGHQIHLATGLPTGTITPMLRRLAADGCLVLRREEHSTDNEGRPLRRYYRLNPEAVAAAHDYVAKVPGASNRHYPFRRTFPRALVLRQFLKNPLVPLAAENIELATGMSSDRLAQHLDALTAAGWLRQVGHGTGPITYVLTYEGLILAPVYLEDAAATVPDDASSVA
jgi:PadR family transcriptional regulator, regulatory protein PadR